VLCSSLHQAAELPWKETCRPPDAAGCWPSTDFACAVVSFVTYTSRHTEVCIRSRCHLGSRSHRIDSCDRRHQSSVTAPTRVARTVSQTCYRSTADVARSRWVASVWWDWCRTAESTWQTVTSMTWFRCVQRNFDVVRCGSSHSITYHSRLHVNTWTAQRQSESVLTASISWPTKAS